jgi:SagB-type dehydrogenase family enzyme
MCHVGGSLFWVRFIFLLLAYPVFADTQNIPRPEPKRGVDELPLEQRRAFLRGTLSDWRIDTDDRRGVEPPPIQKPYPADAKRLDLLAPDSFTLGTLSVKEAILNRRSRRDFSEAPFSLEELSYLLWATQGISRIERDEKGKIVAQYRTVPSGGARHPFETYLLINRVTGLKPGLYRYLPVEHQLLVIKEDPALGHQVTASTYRQSFTGTSAVTFIWTAIPYRTEWHYGTIAEKLVAIDIGHVCQNLYLAVESIRSGMCAVMGYNQARMDALLGVDGKDEFVIYLAAAGKLTDTKRPGMSPMPSPTFKP